MVAPRTILAVALLLAAPVDLVAQREPVVAPGDRVRVSAGGVFPGRLVGTVMSLTPDTFVLEIEGRSQPLALPLASLETLQVSRGRKSHWPEGAVIGALAGAGIGTIVSYRFGFGCVAKIANRCVATGGWILGGLLGLLIGADIGASIKSDRWETVPLDQVRVGPTLDDDGGLAVWVSAAF